MVPLQGKQMHGLDAIEMLIPHTPLFTWPYMATIAKFWHKGTLINLAYPYYTPKEVQVILTFVTVAKNSDLGLNGSLWEKIFWHVFFAIFDIFPHFLLGNLWISDQSLGIL